MRVDNQRLYKNTPFQNIIELFKLLLIRKALLNLRQLNFNSIYGKGVMANKSNSLSHTKWLCKYHIVFSPKYRRKVIYGQYRESIKEIIQRLCSYKGVDIIEGHMMSDHVHLLLSIPPKFSVAQFMGYLKGKSALMIFDKHANLKYKFGNRHFWAEGYYVSTVGFNEATVKKYIREQESRDIALDKLSVKEFEDPFKGGK